MAMLIATHKLADLPGDAAYIPVHVGSANGVLKLPFQPDSTGDHISWKNPTYCELTAIYWAWKNLPVSVSAVGLSHYRRYFRGTTPGPSNSRVLSGPSMAELMTRFDIVVPRPRNYIVETVESHYRHGHPGSDIDALREALDQVAPEYSDAFERVMRGKSVSLYNMFLMRTEAFREYAAWLFPLLEAVEKSIDTESRDAYQKRAFGFLGERLLNVWIAQNSGRFRIHTLPVVNTDGEPKLVKGVAMIRRKITGQSGRRA